MTVFWKANRLVRKSIKISRTHRNSHSSTKMLMEMKEEIKKYVLLEDLLASNWTVAALLDIKGNKAIKKFVLTNQSVFLNTVTLYNFYVAQLLWCMLFQVFVISNF